MRDNKKYLTLVTLVAETSVSSAGFLYEPEDAVKWVGLALVFIGIATPFLTFPFVEADKGQNIIIHGYLELSKGTPRYEPKNDFERVQRIVHEYNAEMAGQSVEIAPYYDNPVVTAYATIIPLGIAANIAGGLILTVGRRSKESGSPTHRA